MNEILETYIKDPIQSKYLKRSFSLLISLSYFNSLKSLFSPIFWPFNYSCYLGEISLWFSRFSKFNLYNFIRVHWLKRTHYIYEHLIQKSIYILERPWFLSHFIRVDVIIGVILSIKFWPNCTAQLYRWELWLVLSHGILLPGHHFLG